MRLTYERSNGVFHTPKELARFVAELAIKDPRSTILDPCFGEGSLLLAARNRLSEIGSNNPDTQLFGFDIAPSQESLQRSPLRELFQMHKLKQSDFFALTGKEPQCKFGTILMNPPFVRHHFVPKQKLQALQGLMPEDIKLPLTSDLWAYFVLHALRFMQEKGGMAAILPWSLMYADYARPVRELLVGRFQKVKVVLMGQQLFDGAEQRILVLFAEGFGSGATHVGIHYSFGIPAPPFSWTHLKHDMWIKSPWQALVSDNTRHVLADIGRRLGFVPLSKYAKVHIGVVTGANGFFVIQTGTATSMRLPKTVLKPVVARSSDLCKLTISSSDGIDDVLLLIPEDMKLSNSLKTYISIGEKKGMNRKCHTKKRAKWYSIPVQTAPDAFLPYTTQEAPFLVFNPEGLWSTNTVHGVYFSENADEQIRKWIQLSMLTSVSQLSVELGARTYGGGVLKVEPSDANEISVCPGKGLTYPTDLQREVDTLLLQGKRLEAVHQVDCWMVRNLGISKEDMNIIIESYQNLRLLRWGKGNAMKSSYLVR
jgi:adenine-specific DNA-methyltransferase